MRLHKLGILLLGCCLHCFISLAQNKTAGDTLQIDSVHKATESLLLEQQKKAELDSMIRIQLEKELQLAAGDRQKTKELEQKLRSAAVEDSLHKMNQLQKIAALKKNAKGFAVAPFKDTLFLLYTRIGSFNVKERVDAVNQRINKLYDSPIYNSDSLRIISTDDNIDILYGSENIVMTVNSMDGLWAGKDKNELAQEYFTKIKTAVAKEERENSFTNWLKRIGYVALTILILALLIFLIRRFFRAINRFLYRHKERYFKGITIRKIQILTPERHLRFAVRINNAIRIFSIILIVYLSLPLLFSLFPDTQAWTNTLLEWVLRPAKVAFHGFVKFLPNLFTIVVIYLIFKYIIRVIKYFMDEIQKRNINISGFHHDWAMPTFKIIQFILYAFMLVIIFPYLPGSSSPAFQGVSVFIGVLFSLGSSSAISNIIAGLVITYMRPFQIGDRVQIGETVGDVIEKTLLVTRIRTIKNEDITVPNATVLSSNTINYSTNANNLGPGLIMHTTVTIGYDAPWKDVQQALIKAALRTDLILKEPIPFVLQTSLDDFYVAYQINAYTKDANKQATIYSQLHQNIQDCFNEAGIEIMSPHYNAHRDGSKTTIPDDYLDKDYKTPGFNVNVKKEE